jgi:ribose transport system substrate-binding protein
MIRLSRRARGAVAVALAVTGLAACGHAKASSGPVRVAYLAASSKATFAVQISDGYRFGVGQVPGVEQTVLAPDVIDPVKQGELFSQIAKTNPAAISFSLASPDALADPMNAAAKQGIALTAVDIPPMPGSPVDLYVGNDNYDMGRQLADLIIAKLSPDAAGDVVVGNVRPGLAALDMRAIGIQEQFHKRLPKVRVLGPFDAGSVNPAGARQAFRTLVLANPHALAFISTGVNGAELVGLKHDTHGTWISGAFDLDPAGLAAVKQGELVLVSPEQFLKGAMTGRLQAEHAKANTAPPKGWVLIPGLPVTAQNIDEIIGRESSPATRMAWYQPKLDALYGKKGPAVRPLSQAR